VKENLGWCASTQGEKVHHIEKIKPGMIRKTNPTPI